MKKKLYALNSVIVVCACLCLNVNNSLFSQTSIVWERSYGGSGGDFGKTICTAVNGNFLLGGYTNSNDGDISGAIGNMDVFVMCIDSFGTINWQKNYGGSGNDFIHGLLATKDGGAVIEGFTMSTDLPGYKDAYDVWLTKIDANGNIEWQKTYGGTGDDGLHGVDVKEHPQGGYIMTTSTESDDGDITGNKGAGDSWLVRLSASGDIKWEKCLGGSADEDTHVVLIASDTGYVVAGHTTSTDGDVSGLHSPGLDDGWVFKTDSLGNLEWQMCIGGSGTEIFNSGYEVNGGFIFIGYSDSDDGDVNLNKGWEDGWIVKIDINGNLLWSKTYGGSQGDFFSNVISYDKDIINICGLASSLDGDVQGNKGYADYWVVQLDANGDLLWQRCAGGPESDRGEFIYPLSDSSWLVTGFSMSLSGDISVNQGFTDAWTFRLELVDCSGINADFEYSPLSICVNDIISITNNSLNADSSAWYINGNYYSSLFEPDFVFNIPRIDSIALVVFSGVCTDTMYKIIETKPLPYVSLGADTVICYTCHVFLDAGNPTASYLWSTGETTQQIISSQHPDTISVIVNLNGCVAYDTIIVDIFTNIYDNFHDNLKIYPNPIENLININFNNTKSKNVFYKIMSISGKEIQKGEISSHQNIIDMSEIPEGVYILELIIDSNLYKRKIVKV